MANIEDGKEKMEQTLNQLRRIGLKIVKEPRDFTYRTKGVNEDEL